jgi:lipid A disaccharide synthetase
MTFMLMDEIKKYYKNSAVDMPQRHYLNRFVRDFRQWTEKYVDHMHYTVPLTTSTGDNYQFPGEYIGQYGAYEAVKHIYNSNPNLKHLVSECGNELNISKKYFASDLEKGINSVRSSWRAKNSISDDSTVIFFAPGNERTEAEFCVENVRRGIKEFLLKYSAPTSLSAKALPLENFATVISLHSGSEGEAYVREYLRENQWHGKVIIVTEEGNEHYDAMCAADQGLIYDGQMVSAAAACHLPILDIINMRMHHQWYNQLFNRFWCDMNIIANNMIIPEIQGGEAWFGKIADSLAETYVRPDTRFETIARLDGFVAEALSYKTIDREVVKTRELILSDG